MHLYTALRMNGGEVELSAGAGADALREGVLPLPADTALSRSTVQLRNEPVCASVLAEVGRGHVSIDPCADPVFQLLGESVAHGRVAGFGMTTSVRGDVLDLAFAWSVLRTVTLSAPRSLPGPSLADVLGPLVPRGFEMPLRAHSEYVIASAGFSCRNVKSAHGTTDLHRLCEAGAELRVLYNIDAAAGADVAFLTVDDDGQPASVVMVQAKARKAAELAECLLAASPAWQYTETDSRTQALAGKAFKPTAKRAAFQRLATASATAPRFATAFRVALSSRGFRPETVAA